MQVQNSVKPEKKFNIENIENGRCTVLFFDNIKEIKQDLNILDQETFKETKLYSYNIYEMDVDYRENLAEEIEANMVEWLDLVKQSDYNNVAAEIRKKRDDLLTETDWTQMVDVAISKEEQEQYRIYRQELRDIPEQKTFPYDVIFPNKPM